MSILVAGLPLLILAIALSNRLTWPRGQVGKTGSFDVSVLIPARNEVGNLEPLLRSLTRQTFSPTEIIVYDDASTDGTAELLERLRPEIAQLTVARGRGLPPGWVGKPHACHQLARMARGSTLLFLDADVQLEPSGIERLLRVSSKLRAAAVTAVPRQRVVTWLERLVVPLLHVTYMAWLPLPLIWLSRDPRFLAANGQMLLVQRATYDAVGGFAAVRDAIVDDMAFCRRVKSAGHRVAFADGHEMAKCRMYRTGAEVWAGFSKNIYLGVGARPVRLALALTLYVAAFVLPLAALVLPGHVEPTAAVVGAVASTLTAALVTIRHRYPPSTIVLIPFGILVLVAIGLNSFRWHLNGRIRWRDRVYGSALSSQEITP